MRDEVVLRSMLLRKKRELENLERDYKTNTDGTLTDHYIYEIANCLGVITGLEFALGE